MRIDKNNLKAKFFCRPDGEILTKAKPLYPAIRKKIYDRDGGCCVVCGKKCDFHTCAFRYDFTKEIVIANIDHIVPRSRGGQNVPDNLVTMCEHCNKSKGAGI